MILCILDDNGICVNRIVAQEQDEAFLGDGQTYAPNHDGQVGWTWDGSAWIEPDERNTLAQEDMEAVVRAQRNTLLLRSDWVVIAAYEKGDIIAQEWQDYRQALRDIPTQEGFPYSVTWPTEPAE